MLVFLNVLYMCVVWVFVYVFVLVCVNVRARRVFVGLPIRGLGICRFGLGVSAFWKIWERLKGLLKHLGIGLGAFGSSWHFFGRS